MLTAVILCLVITHLHGWGIILSIFNLSVCPKYIQNWLTHSQNAYEKNSDKKLLKDGKWMNQTDRMTEGSHGEKLICVLMANHF